MNTSTRPDQFGKMFVRSDSNKNCCYCNFRPQFAVVSCGSNFANPIPYFRYRVFTCIEFFSLYFVILFLFVCCRVCVCVFMSVNGQTHCDYFANGRKKSFSVKDFRHLKWINDTEWNSIAAKTKKNLCNFMQWKCYWKSVNWWRLVFLSSFNSQTGWVFVVWDDDDIVLSQYCKSLFCQPASNRNHPQNKTNQRRKKKCANSNPNPELRWCWLPFVLSYDRKE